MAQAVGIQDVLAGYGRAHDTPAYELLRRVSHWSEEDVGRERAMLEQLSIKPSFTIAKFSDLLDLFDFGSSQ